MPTDPTFILTLAIRMVVASAFIVSAAAITERSGPVIGALVTTLPFSAGPSYIFLALDHDAAFIAESALASLPANIASVSLVLIYTVLAQRQSLAISAGIAIVGWLALAAMIREFHWSLAGGIMADIVAFAICLPLLRRFRHVAMPPIRRRWYDIPMRAAMVAMLVAILAILSGWVGPGLSGTIALFPISFVCMMLALHRRIGGPATAAITANGGWGMAGFSVALVVLHLAALQFGSAIGLGLALTTSIAWNLGLWWIARRKFVR